MSKADNSGVNATRTEAETFEDEGNELHAAALFSPREKQREQALKQLRAKSSLTPDDWGELDAAVFPEETTAKKVEELTADSTLSTDAFKQLSENIVEEPGQSNTIISDLVGAGFAVDTSLARMVSEYRTTNDFDGAERSMDGRERGTEEGSVFGRKGVPLPISHVHYEYSAREIRNKRNFGESVDSQDARKAGDAVRDDLEDLAVNGWVRSVTSEGVEYNLHGFRTQPNRINDTAGNFGGGSWDTDGNVIDTLNGMLNSMEQQGDDDNEGYIPAEEGVWLYTSTANYGQVTRSYDSTHTDGQNVGRILERDYPYVDVRHSGAMPAGEAVMVAQNSDVVDLADAQPITNMAWDVDGGLGVHNVVLGCRVPRVKNTMSGKTGIVHVTGL